MTKLVHVKIKLRNRFLRLMFVVDYATADYLDLGSICLVVICLIKQTLSSLKWVEK
jgi:hypothetical protein